MNSTALLRRSRLVTNSLRRSSPAVLHRRLISTVPPTENVDQSSSTPDPTEPEPPAEDADRPRIRRPRITTTMPKDVDPVELPEDLDLLWCPAEEEHNVNTTQTALPPSEVFEEALHNLHITLHPQTQHRATYPSLSGPPIEPTLGLYCPIEGGDYIIDATVKELARRTGAEVLVLDAVQLAAGEWGHFGKAANALQFPRNPLHFTPPVVVQTVSRREAQEAEDDDDFGLPMFSQPQQMTLTVMAPLMQGRTLMTSSPRRTPSPSNKIKVFFDALVNTPSNYTRGDKPSSSTITDRPRLIYIRDYPTLAASSDIWYPPLLSAVRARRRGPMSRPTSIVANPMTIIFGMSPPLLPPNTPSHAAPENGLMSVLMSRNTTQVSSSNKPGKVDFGEDEAAEKAREKRLRERLKKWERNDASLFSEFPPLHSGNEVEEEGRPSKPELIVIGGPSGMGGLPSLFGSHMGSGQSSKAPSSHDSTSNFFRASVLVPSIRSPTHEKASRVARRRQINELTMRMGVGAIGGKVEEGALASTTASEDVEPSVEAEASTHQDSPSTKSEPKRLWDEWGNKLEMWSDVRRIADRAVGNIMSSSLHTLKLEKISLEPTVIPWSAVESAWTSHKANRDLRKQWLRDISPTHSVENQEDGVEERAKGGVDEIIERLKSEHELEDHEERLLSCIVNPVNLPTSFSQVHLPVHTIDSVRTIVSLPLLHPLAFKSGILKDHSMTGCLLFGPPGTGKTLVVRALAKEAGCRMLAVSPSDVMDMYVGEGEKLVRAVFSLARKLSPCVVFLDEIDALFGARMSTRESGGAFAHRGVITEFMQEMDGLKSSKDDAITVIGATNRPFDLDDAVLRRLPRRLLVDLPGEKEREAIIKILLNDEVLATDVDISQLAKQTESFSGSDLKHLCVSAALDAVKEYVQLPWLTTSSAASTLQTEPVKAVPVDIVVPSESAVEPTSSDGSASAEQVFTTVGEAAHTSETSTTTTIGDTQKPTVPDPSEQPRVLHLRNFTKALKEITPSSSESLGSLAELRKWNEEFGEGRQNRKRQQVWGRGRFGFIDTAKTETEEGHVVAPRTRSQILQLLDMQ